MRRKVSGEDDGFCMSGVLGVILSLEAGCQSGVFLKWESLESFLKPLIACDPSAQRSPESRESAWFDV